MGHFGSQSTTIDTAPEELFDYLAAIDTTDWYDGWEGVSHDGREKFLVVGASFRLTRRGTPSTVECRVVEAVAPTGLSWNEYGLDGTAIRVTFRLQPAAEGATLLTHSKRRIAAI